MPSTTSSNCDASNTSDVLACPTCEESRDGLNLRGAVSDIDARKNARFPRGRQASAHNQPALGYQDGRWTWHQKVKLSKKRKLWTVFGQSKRQELGMDLKRFG